MFNFEEKILNFFEKVFIDLFDSIFIFLYDIIFSHEKMPSFFTNLYEIFLAIGSGVVIAIVLFRVVTSMIINRAYGGSDQVTVSELIIKTFIACAMIPIMPFILILIVGKIVYPLGEWMFLSISEAAATTVMNNMRAGEMGEFLSAQVMMVIIFGFIAVAVTVFTIKMCIYHADLILLQVLSIWAAISILAEDNNYSSVWWREVLSQVTTIVVQVAIMAGLVELLSTEITWWSFMLIIGFSVLLIRGPSVTRHMWYATGSSKVTIGQAGKFATRLSMVGMRKWG